MPRKLVIHVGAQKCASSSLQASLRSLEAENPECFSFAFPKPAALHELQQLIQRNDTSGFAYLDETISRLSADQAVLSHEMLGNRPRLVSCIADRAIREHGFDEVVIAGYTRLQSNYHVSAFSQWFFRDQKMLQNDISVLKRNQLDWRLFSALERSLIALVKSKKDRSWRSNYQGFVEGVKHIEDRVRVVSNHIPTRNNPYLLIENFFELTGLKKPAKGCDLGHYDVRRNESFSPVVVFALSSYLSLKGLRPTCFPGPHEGNRWLFRVCDRLDSDSSLSRDAELLFERSLLDQLCGHLDCRVLGDNYVYCQEMNVDQTFFQPSDTARLMSWEEIFDLVNLTAKNRELKLIKRFNCRAQDLFMNAARAEIVSN